MSECKFCGEVDCGFVASDPAVHAETIVTLKAKIEKLEATNQELLRMQTKFVEEIGKVEAQLDAVRELPDTEGWKNCDLRGHCANAVKQALEQKP